MTEALVPIGVGNLADAIADVENGPKSVMRIGAVTAIDNVTGTRKVTINIAGTTWCSRLQDIDLAVGDRVCVLQQDNVMLVVGRLSGFSTNVPIGGILLYAGTTPPLGWYLCQGQFASRTSFAALFAIIGTTYGIGNGVSTFNLPNLVDRVPVGAGNNWAAGAIGGEFVNTLTVGQLPSHTHGQISGSWLVGANAPGGGSQNLALYNSGAQTGSTGSGDTIENMQPFQAINYMIRAF